MTFVHLSLIQRRTFLKTGLLACGFLAIPNSVRSAPSQKVATLTTLTADIVERLDRNQLVGIPANRLLEEDPRFSGITSLGLGNAPNLEQLIALEPDWVIGASGFHTTLAERLEEFGIPVYLTSITSWAALEETIQTIAEKLNVDPSPLVQDYAQLLPDQAPSSGPKTLLLAGTQPIVSPNRESWAGDLLARFGADNLTAQLQSQGQFRGYVTLSAESILAADPDVILVVNPEAEDPVANFRSRPFWNQLQAVKNEQVYAFDYYGIVNPGTLDKIAIACAQLWDILSV